MAMTEQQRFEMHLGLRENLGDDVADTLMEHLPPSGWSDVVRLRDLQILESRIDRLTGSFRVFVASVLTVGIAILVMLVQLNFAIAKL